MEQTSSTQIKFPEECARPARVRGSQWEMLHLWEAAGKCSNGLIAINNMWGIISLKVAAHAELSPIVEAEI